MLKHASLHLPTETLGTIPDNPQAILRKNSGVATHFKGILVSSLRGKRGRKKVVPLLHSLLCASAGWLPDWCLLPSTAFSRALLLPDTHTQSKPITTREQNQRAHREPANGAVFSTFPTKPKVYVRAKMSKPPRARLFADVLGLTCNLSSSFSWGYIFKDPSLEISCAILSISRVFKIPQALPSGVKVTLTKQVGSRAL